MNAPEEIKGLEGMDDEALMRLYQRVFNTPDGLLVLEDLRNRFFYYSPAHTQIDEGLRRAVIHIQNTMKSVNQATQTKEI